MREEWRLLDRGNCCLKRGVRVGGAAILRACITNRRLPHHSSRFDLHFHQTQNPILFLFCQLHFLHLVSAMMS